MNCELMLTFDTPALWQTGSRNLTGQKTLPTIWGNYRRWPGMSSQNGDVALIDIVLNVHMWSYHKSRIQT